MDKYPLAVSSWDDAEIKAIHRVLDKGITTMGECVEEFEKQFALYIGSKYCVMVNSGSSANLLAVASLFYRNGNMLTTGDEVIAPAVSWATTYYPLHQYGLKIKFVDIDLDTLNYDLDALEEAVTGNTKLIVAVNLLGNPNDFNKINTIIGTRDIILIEDNCESMGAIFDGKQAGTFGLMGTFSSFFSHHISTMEGGMIVTNDEELYHILLSLRSHGWTRHLPKKNKVCGTKSDDEFKEWFRFVLPGYNVRPLEMMGAIGIEQLKKLPYFVRVRRENAEYFHKIFNDNPDFIIQEEIGLSSWFGFSLIIKEGVGLDRKEIVATLTKNGISSRPINAGNFAEQEVLKWFDYSLFGEMKNASYLGENGFFVGNHHFCINDKIDYLWKVLKGE